MNDHLKQTKGFVSGSLNSVSMNSVIRCYVFDFRFSVSLSSVFCFSVSVFSSLETVQPSASAGKHYVMVVVEMQQVV